MPYQPRAGFDSLYGPQVTFRTLDVLPPSAFYIALDDQIICDVSTDVAPTVYYFALRMLNPQGIISVESYTLSNLSPGYNTVAQVVTGMEGYILSFSLSAPGVPLSSAFANISLVRQPYTTQLNTCLLASGYVSNTQLVSFPAQRPSGPLVGPAQLKTVTASPAAGADWSVSCPVNTRWQVMNCMSSLTTSAAVANRSPDFLIRDNTNTEMTFFPCNFNQTASTTVYYSLLPGGANAQTTNLVAVSASAVVLIENGGSIASQTSGIQPADQWATVRVQVQEWVGL